MKKKILFLCSHKPTRDPRIGWEVSSLSKIANVNVIGVEPSDDESDKFESNKVYKYRVIKKRFVHNPVLLEQFYRRTIENSHNSFVTFIFKLLLYINIHKFLFKFTYRFFYKYATFNYYTNYFAQVFAYLYQATEDKGYKPDIVHCTDLDTLLVGVVLKRKYHCKLFYSAHELWPDTLRKNPRYIKAFIRAFESELIKEVDTAITVSPYIAKVMENWYKIKNIETIPNLEMYKKTPMKKTDISNKIKGRVAFLFQGNYMEERGLQQLIDAWQEIDEKKAVLILRGPQNFYFDKFRIEFGYKLAKENVLISKAVDEEDLVGAAKEADVGIIPYEPLSLNNKYCCPNKLSQYMQAGLAILSNNLQYIKDIMGTYKCGISYDSLDKATIVKRINYYLEHKDLLKKHKKNALYAGRHDFNWQAYEQKFLGIYKELLGK